MGGGTIVVQKYGGSSVADPTRLGQVADRVAATVKQGHRVVVVVSAMGKTTDELIALAHSVTKAPPRRELDMLTSAGERISMALLAMALSERGHEAISFTGSQSGILTNDRHSGARIIEVRPVRIEDELDRGKVVIVAGFQGMSYKREITTLGRGGSDTTAVALAAALNAEYCEIYSDVDGVYSADPKVVPAAQHLPEVSYDAMQELAEHGAKVLNAQAVEWAKKAQITIYARATTGSAKQTEVKADAALRPRVAAIAVAAMPRVVVATGGAALLDLLAEAHISLSAIRNMGGAAATVEARFEVKDVPDWARISTQLVQSGCTLVEVGAVSAVGPNVGSDPALIRRALAAVPTYLSYRASPLRLTLEVPLDGVAAAAAALHRELCE